MNDYNKRVVITSAGVVSSIGTGVDVFYENLKAGKSGLKEIQSFDTSEFNCKEAYEIQDFDPTLYLGKKGLRNLDRVTKFVLVAAHLALEKRNDIESMGLVLGSAYSGLHSIYEFERTAIRDGFVAVNPMHFPNTVFNALTSQINIRFGITKLSETICTGLSSGIDAIGHAYKLIKNGQLEVVLCGGADELNLEIFSWMNLTGSFSGLGEGAGLFVIESLENSQKNNSEILGEIAGYGSDFSAQSDFSEEVAVQCSINAINKTLNDASITANEVNFVSKNANQVQDEIEDKVLETIFSDKLENFENINANIGACLGATGALQLASLIKRIEDIDNILISSVGNSRLNSGLILKRFV